MPRVTQLVHQSWVGITGVQIQGHGNQDSGTDHMSDPDVSRKNHSFLQGPQDCLLQEAFPVCLSFMANQYCGKAGAAESPRLGDRGLVSGPY